MYKCRQSNEMHVVKSLACLCLLAQAASWACFQMQSSSPSVIVWSPVLPVASKHLFCDHPVPVCLSVLCVLMTACLSSDGGPGPVRLCVALLMRTHPRPAPVYVYVLCMVMKVQRCGDGLGCVWLCVAGLTMTMHPVRPQLASHGGARIGCLRDRVLRLGTGSRATACKGAHEGSTAHTVTCVMHSHTDDGSRATACRKRARKHTSTQ